MNVYVGNEKGGSTKTTTLLFLSLFMKKYSPAGDNVVLIDSDRKQQRIKKLMFRRKQNNLIYVPVVKEEKEDMVLNNSKYFTLIDGRANINEEDMKFIDKADFVIVPSSTSNDDYESTKDFITFLENKGKKFKVLFSKVDDKEELEEAIKYIGKENCFDEYIKYNKKFRKKSKDSGETDLDLGFLNPRKYGVRSKMEKITNELLGYLKNK